MPSRASPAGILPERLQALLIEAVNTYSPSFHEEPCTRVFERALLAAGLSPERQPVPGPSPRDNLIVKLGPQPPALMFVGHLDTIEAAPDHAEARCTIDADVLHGLGAADMKAGCAAMVEAVIALHTAHPQLDRGLVLALVVGEEEYGDGAQALVQAGVAPLTILGEPTSVVPCIDHSGYLEALMISEGTRAHAAVPEHGADAIRGMLVWMLGVLELLDQRQPQGSISANPREIRGGSTMFVVPERCEALLDVHWRPSVAPQSVFDAIERARQTALRLHPSCGLRLEARFQSDGFQAPADDPRLQPLRRAFEDSARAWLPGVFRSHSDACIFHAAGSRAVVCGPGSLAVAHSAAERVSIDEAIGAAMLYEKIARRACLD